MSVFKPALLVIDFIRNNIELRQEFTVLTHLYSILKHTVHVLSLDLKEHTFIYPRRLSTLTSLKTKNC